MGSFNSVFCDETISRKTKRHIGRETVESVLCYNYEVWTLNTEIKGNIFTAEIDQLRRREGLFRIERIWDQEISGRMEAVETVLERTENGKLNK